ncbi:unnamed protein product [Linum trigynum]|uniref:Uncharacterized protein n=1 Tax=Linum trigynum TaxID=586398 RepID=A0AAV2CE48_9ROSI
MTTRIMTVEERLNDVATRTSSLEDRLTALDAQITEISGRSQTNTLQLTKLRERSDSLTMCPEGHSQQLATIITQSRAVDARLNGFEEQLNNRFTELLLEIRQGRQDGVPQQEVPMVGGIPSVVYCL